MTKNHESLPQDNEVGSVIWMDTEVNKHTFKYDNTKIIMHKDLSDNLHGPLSITSSEKIVECKFINNRLTNIKLKYTNDEKYVDISFNDNNNLHGDAIIWNLIAKFNDGDLKKVTNY